MGVADDIFQHRAEAVGRLPDLWLRLTRKPDDLGIATAFEVEDAAIGPAMLVIANQLPLRVGGQGGLAGAGEAEEQRHMAIASEIGAAMHRQHALLRQQPIHDGKDRFLDLAGIAGAADHDRAGGERECDAGTGAAAIGGGIGLVFRRVQNGEIRLEIRQFRPRWTDEHVAGEQRMPGIRGDQSDLDAVRGIGAGIEVLGEQDRAGAKPSLHLAP